MAVLNFFVHESRSFVFTHICEVGKRLPPVILAFEAENYFGKLWIFVEE